ncbi:MAG: hypothetical protein MUF07_07270 [Steroidobacteraceae bacterium]|jgi:hypothetical protein|nr:hypothetical protein [Steroidobacteraceae bacterium]
MPTRRELLAALGSGAALACSPSAPAAVAAGSSSPHPGLLLGPGPAGRCDDSKVGIGVPRWDARSRRWLLWYYCRDAAYDPMAPRTLGTGRVALASSRDGLAWQRVDGPLGKAAVLEHGVEPDYDALHLGITDVTWARGRWWMWCFGGNRDRRPTIAGALPGMGMRPGLATSRDGLHWAKLRGRGPGGALIDIRNDQEVFASWVNGLYVDGRFGMMFTTVDNGVSQFRSWLAWSDDALAWSEPQELRFVDGARDWDGKGIMTRHVQRNPLGGEGRWLMAYTALHGERSRNMERSVALAVSDDLVAWRRLHDVPVFTVGPAGSWDAGGVSAPQLLKVGRELRLYYFGFPPPRDEERLPKGVGLAISRDGSPGSFERWQGTPAA